MPRFCRRWGLLCLVVVWPLLTVGCGEQAAEAPGLVAVTGTVTLDGKPLAGATVMSSPLPPASGTPPAFGAPSSGVTDAEGRFTLMYRGQEPGAVPGPCEIRITASTLDENAVPTEETLPPRYNTSSTLTETVKPGEPNVFLFELTSK